MRVNINFTLDVNPEDWADVHGVEGSANIRADVKEYAKYLLMGQMDNDGIRNEPV